MITGVLSAKSQDVVRRNMAILPAYTLMLGLLALLGYMAIAAGIQLDQPNFAVPDLMIKYFPSWFEGFAFAAIGIGALVPAAVMSIAAANLFTRNIYKEYLKRDASDSDQAQMAKIVSLLVKAGALAFVLFLPTDYAIDLQLLGGVWIAQTLPALFVGLMTRWLDRRALLAGWLAGMVAGTSMAASQGFAPTYELWRDHGLHRDLGAAAQLRDRDRPDTRAARGGRGRRQRRHHPARLRRAGRDRTPGAGGRRADRIAAATGEPGGGAAAGWRRPAGRRGQRRGWRRLADLVPGPAGGWLSRR